MAFALRQYRAGGEFVANRDIEYGDRVFKAGEKFPWRELGMHEVRVHELWRANMVDSADPAARADRLDQKPAAKPAQQRQQRR